MITMLGMSQFCPTKRGQKSENASQKCGQMDSLGSRHHSPKMYGEAKQN